MQNKYTRTVNFMDRMTFNPHPMFTDQIIGRIKFPNKWAIGVVYYTLLNVFDVTIYRNDKIAQHIPINSNTINSEMELLDKHQVEYIMSQISQL